MRVWVFLERVDVELKVFDHDDESKVDWLDLKKNLSPNVIIRFVAKFFQKLPLRFPGMEKSSFCKKKYKREKIKLA